MRPGNEHLAEHDPISFGSGRDGFTFTGRCVEEKSGETKHGSSPVLIFDDGGSRLRILWAYHVGLQREWNAAAPKRDDLVTITRSPEPVPFGTEGRASYNYTVVVEQEDEDNFDGLERLGAYMEREPEAIFGGQTDDISY